MSTEKKWYVYLLCDPDTEEPFYVGKGTGSRMHKHERLWASEHNEQKMQTIRDIKARGQEVLKKKIAEFADEQDAYIYEWGTIWAYHDRITNINPGGQGHPSRPRRENDVRGLEEDRLWSIKDLARYLEVSCTKARRLIDRCDGLPYSQWGDSTSPLRFRPEAVYAWADRHGLKPIEASSQWNMTHLMCFLGFGYTKTWRLIHQYGLPCYQLGDETSPFRFDPDEVRTWARQYRKELSLTGASGMK